MQVIMPKLGLTMTHGTIAEWLKQPGDRVKAEESLCVYETEKVTLELPAPAEGVLTEILAPVGTAVAAGGAVCTVETPDDRRVMADGSQRSESRAQEAGGREQPPTRNMQHPLAVGHVFASPKAKSLARQLGVDLSRVTGRGPEGRVQAADIPPLTPSLTARVSGAQGENAPGVRGAIKATPLARRIATAEGIDLRTLTGSGPEGTITREDVEAVIGEAGTGKKGPAAEISRQPSPAGRELGTTAPGETVLPLTTLRRIIGERMSQSASSAPQVTLMTEAEATNLVSARQQLNEELALNVSGASKAPGTSGLKISYNALFAALVARALREYPQLNATFAPDGIHLLAQINIALAVDTERGLMTPVLPRVDELNLAAIQRGYDALTGRALAGKSLPADFEGGTFTITNLGSLDVDGFTPIINPPQAAILGVGRIVEKPVARDGAVVIRPMLTLSLSFDHRIVDGAPAAKFLQRIKQLVERPMALLVG